MIICPYNTCAHNKDKCCTRVDIVLDVIDDETEDLTCLSYERKGEEDYERSSNEWN